MKGEISILMQCTLFPVSTLVKGLNMVRN